MTPVPFVPCLDCARAACGYRPCPRHNFAAALEYERRCGGSGPYFPRVLASERPAKRARRVSP